MTDHSARQSARSTASPAPPPAPPTLPVDPERVEAVRAVARLARMLERAAGDLGMAQYRVLAAVASGDERASRVAERLGLGRPTISAAVEALCRDGFLQRTGSPGDQRAVDLSLTGAGRAELTRVEDRMAALLADVVDRGADPGTVPVLAALGPSLDRLQRERHARRTANA